MDKRHFSDSLAEYASSLLINYDGSSHRWSVEQAKSKFDELGLHKREFDTWGDVTYAANYAYASLFPLLSDDECFEFALLYLDDNNGYEGRLYDLFINSAKERGISAKLESYE